MFLLRFFLSSKNSIKIFTKLFSWIVRAVFSHHFLPFLTLPPRFNSLVCDLCAGVGVMILLLAPVFALPLGCAIIIPSLRMDLLITYAVFFQLVHPLKFLPYFSYNNSPCDLLYYLG